MKTFFVKALTVLAAFMAFSNPAAAQLNGELEFISSPVGAFSTKLALGYGLKLGGSTNLSFEFRYTNQFAPFLDGSGAIRFGATLTTAFSDKVGFGFRARYTLASLGLDNTSRVNLTTWLTLNLVSRDDLSLDAKLEFTSDVVPGFNLGSSLYIDATYVINENAIAFFGLEADFTLISSSGFSFDAFSYYFELDYAFNNQLVVFGGSTIILDTTGFSGFDLNAGLRYNLSDSFAVRLIGGYDTAFYVRLALLFNR